MPRLNQVITLQEGASPSFQQMETLENLLKRDVRPLEKLLNMLILSARLQTLNKIFLTVRLTK